MKSIVVASQNPVKSQAVYQAFTRAFPDEEFTVKPCSVTSGVSAQPMSNAETLAGAHQRIVGARQLFPQADYWVSIEGGIEEEFGNMNSFAWVCIFSRGIWGKARSGTFALPEMVAALIRAGKELGEADDIVFERHNSKQKNGAVGLLTNNCMDRTELYEHAIILALIPFLQPDFLTQE